MSRPSSCREEIGQQKEEHGQVKRVLGDSYKRWLLVEPNGDGRFHARKKVFREDKYIHAYGHTPDELFGDIRAKDGKK